MLIKNFDALNKTPQRKICLDLIESALLSIQPENIIQKNISLKESILTIQNKTFDLKNFDRIFLIGFGKGSADISKKIETLLKDRLTDGYVIDTTKEEFSKIKFTLGTHPLPSQENFDFTHNVISKFSNLTGKDLVLVVISGGGSAMLVHPHNITLDEKIKVDNALLKSGADIIEINIVRQHLSDVKGGGLAQILYPSTVISLIFSDVPGNDISYVASGPTVKDHTTVSDAINIIKKYNLEKELNLSYEAFAENPKEDKYFEKVKNIIVLSNLTALQAMKEKAKELGINAAIFTDRFQGEAKLAGKKLINKAPNNQILLVGGETTVKVLNQNGKGGRNQELVLGALQYIDNDTTIASFATDGWDNTEAAGAIGDFLTIQKAKEQNLDPGSFLQENNSFYFFEKTGDGIITGRLPSNVSDLMIVLKK
ncbi:MAG: DUF4147 domain-containing protein [Candidatus Levybacteria bacterium]|nr:DUF4147 domain-containing protein [Candidatus Levybacteria bacterium]